MIESIGAPFDPRLIAEDGTRMRMGPDGWMECGPDGYIEGCLKDLGIPVKKRVPQVGLFPLERYPEMVIYESEQHPELYICVLMGGLLKHSAHTHRRRKNSRGSIIVIGWRECLAHFIYCVRSKQ